ncbi:MAG: TonB-dependent receptor [Acidobacteria bacterium]|nr:MAG: TonB-dependent receptor [Acidobacteriota bacterium]
MRPRRRLRRCRAAIVALGPSSRCRGSPGRRPTPPRGLSDPVRRPLQPSLGLGTLAHRIADARAATRARGVGGPGDRTHRRVAVDHEPAPRREARGARGARGARTPSRQPESFSTRGLAQLTQLVLLLAATVAVVSTGALAQGALETTSSDAATDSQPPESLVEERIVVSAGRDPIPLSEAVPSVVVLDRRALRATSALTAADLLRDVAGFSLLRADSSLAAHPTAQSITLRAVGGTGASRALVLLDGVPLNDAYASWISWNMVPLEALESIEVTQGGGSASWGNLAMGGVLHLATREPGPGRVDLSARGGERGLVDVGVDLATRFGEQERWGVSGHLGRFDFGGYSNIAPQLRGPVDVPLETTAATGHFSLGGNLSDALALRTRVAALDEERGAGTPLSRNATRRLLASVSLDGTSGRSNWTTRLHLQDSTFENVISTVSDDRASEEIAVDQFDIPSSAVGLSATWTRGGERHEPSLGFDTQLTEGENREDFLLVGDRLTRRRIAGGEQFLAGLYVGDRWRFSERMAFELVGRVDRWEKRDGTRDVLDLDRGATLSQERFADGSDTQLSPRLGLVASLADGLTLRTSAYRGFRAPTINELYKPFRLPGNVVNEANPELVPESLLGGEVGLDWSRPRLFARAVAFWNRIDDPVINRTVAVVTTSGFVPPCGFVPAPGSCRVRDNVGSQESYGLDAELRGSWGRRLGWRLQALLVDAEIVEAPPELGLVGSDPPLIASETFSAQLRWSDPRYLDVTLDARHVGSRFADDRNTFPLPSQTLIDLQLSRRFGEHLQGFVAVQNVAGEERVLDASPALERIGPPRLVHVGLRLGWGDR